MPCANFIRDWIDTREIVDTNSTYINLAIGEAIHVDFLVVQDERELKRQRRKQSNRESARRSRLRKQVIVSSTWLYWVPLCCQLVDGEQMWVLQAECEELAQRADVLKQENASLRDEVNRIRKEYEELLSKNNSLKVGLQLFNFILLKYIC